MLMKVSLYQSWDLLGSGKTTLLNVLSSIDYMTKGSITINGKQLEKLSNKQLSDIRKKILIYFSRL